MPKISLPGHWVDFRLYGGAMSRRQVFRVSLLFFVLHQLLQKGFGIHLPFLHAYLDPFLSMPIVLGLLDWERTRRYGCRPL